MIYAGIALFLVLLCVDLPNLIRKKGRKEIIVYSILGGITLLYIVQYTLGIDVFSPIKALSVFFQTTLGLSYELWQGHS